MTEEEFECGWKDGKLLIAPHIKDRMNKMSSKAAGFAPIYVVGEDGAMLKYVEFTPGNDKKKRLILNYCPFCGGKLIEEKVKN